MSKGALSLGSSAAITVRCCPALPFPHRQPTRPATRTPLAHPATLTHTRPGHALHSPHRQPTRPATRTPLAHPATLTHTRPGHHPCPCPHPQVFLHPSSVLLERKPPCLVFNELMHTTKTYARDATAIEPRWLPELAPAFFASKAT